MHTRLPEPQVWGGWGPTPQFLLLVLDDGVSRVAYTFSSYKLESAGSLRAETSMHHAAKSTSHNADNATASEFQFARAVRPRPPARCTRSSADRAHTHHARRRAAPLSLARGRAGAWGHVSSPVSTALYLSSFVLHAPPSDENRLKTLSRATHLHQPPQPVQLHPPPQPVHFHQPPQPVHLHRPPQPVQLHVCYCVTGHCLPLPAATPSVRGRRAPTSVHARESEYTHYTVTHDPSPTLLHMEWSRGRGLVAPSS